MTQSCGRDERDHCWNHMPTNLGNLGRDWRGPSAVISIVQDMLDSYPIRTHPSNIVDAHLDVLPALSSTGTRPNIRLRRVICQDNGACANVRAPSILAAAAPPHSDSVRQDSRFGRSATNCVCG